MIRGRMVLITEDKKCKRHFYMSCEFNGGMDIEQYGQEIIDKFVSGTIKGVKSFYNYVDKFNKEHHQYDDEWLHDEIKLEEWNGECKYEKEMRCSECPYSWYVGKGNKSCTWTMDFHGVSNLYDITSYPYQPDYQYWLNLSDSPIEVLASNGVVEIQSKGGAVFNYDEFLETELDSGLIDAEDSYDFEDEAFKARLMTEWNLTEEEAQECVDNDIKDITGFYNDVKDYGYESLEAYGVESWIIDYMDVEAYGRDNLRSDEQARELESGKVVCW